MADAVLKIASEEADTRKAEIDNVLRKLGTFDEEKSAAEVVRYSITNNPGDIPTYFAELWQPQSISLAPVPNDIDAQIEVKRAIAQKNVKPNYFNLICKNV